MRISGLLWVWFQAYLTLRQQLQCIIVRDQLSDLSPVSSGVPQGSISSLLSMFILMVCLLQQKKSQIFFCLPMILSSSYNLFMRTLTNSIVHWDQLLAQGTVEGAAKDSYICTRANYFPRTRTLVRV